MGIDRERTRQYLKAFDFGKMFTQELGWDKLATTLVKQVDGKDYRFQAVAEKRDVVVLVCDSIPDYAIRVKLDKLIAKDHFEHLIVFADPVHGKQAWQWVRKEPGKPTAVRTIPFSPTQSELLIQKLDGLAFTLEEEETLTLGHVTGRLMTLDVEKVTKKFYERFKTEHSSFLSFIQGIPDKQMESWYASVMVNRLMFLYFIQKKGFLNRDKDYLRNKLVEGKGRKKDAYYTEFLCPLFFEGFARKKAERSAATSRLLGEIPYLNGGLFQKHQIEELHGKTIVIADKAFEKLFDFFKEYDWHLDERENRNDREINPDVLGYIFEKYINQKQMGAYYTKEDITEYIAQNTIVPFLCDEARKGCAVAFAPDGSVWRLLKDDPDRYIHDAMKKGADLALPPEIAAGVTDFKQRTGWNRTAPEEFALPTEIWREAIDRHQRYRSVRARLTAGEVHQVNDLVTLNLNIRQFAQDLIQFCEGPELLRAIWKAIEKVSVLDPTCGSGAFIFAALNILKPLYEACLQRMRGFVEDMESAGPHHPKKFEDFKSTLADSERHPKQDYFILKAIIVNNLFGVDVMEEAVEICKLRLFLKLVAQVESQDNIEPLPDIDFNIRAGNTLVGYARFEDVEKAVNSKLDFGDAMRRIDDKAKTLDAAVEIFRGQQTLLDGTVTAEDKTELQKRFAQLESELNDHLSGENGIRKSDLKSWIKLQKPFHWFCDFHRIITSGGFDVIIGNPPYVEESALKPGSALKGFKTAPCGDLYAYVFERALQIARKQSRIGLIVPISIFGTDGFHTLQSLVDGDLETCWEESFANRPSQLFSGAQKRLTIVLGKKGQGPATFNTGSYLRWTADERDHLFASRICFVSRTNTREVFAASVEKLSRSIELSAFNKIRRSPLTLEASVVKGLTYPVYYTRKFGYFLAFLDFVPKVVEIKTGKKVLPSELKSLGFRTKESALAAIACLSSTSFFWFWNVLSDCRNLNRRDLLAFPIDVDSLPDEKRRSLAKLGDRYIDQLKLTSKTMTKSGLRLQTFDYVTCKQVLDEIDGVIAKHCGLAEAELDFILNYDIKYRLGADDEEG